MTGTDREAMSRLWVADNTELVLLAAIAVQLFDSFVELVFTVVVMMVGISVFDMAVEYWRERRVR